MQKVYAISDWFLRFEVNSGNRAASPGDKLRASPLKHVRHKARGHKLGVRYRQLKEIAGKRRLASVMGVWLKVTELAALHGPDHRGMLLNGDDQPADAEQIAMMFEFDKKQVGFALECLCSVGWLFQANFEGFRCNPLNSAESAENRPKRSETKRIENEAKLNKTKLNETGISVSDSPPDSASARLVFDSALRKVLPARTTSDQAAYRNLTAWAFSQGNGYIEKVLRLAADSKGRNPIAVFFKRLDTELGYRPAVVREKAENSL